MSTSKKQSQASFSGNLPPTKPKNADVRPREYLTDKEVTRLMKAASKVGRHGHRDSTLMRRPGLSDR
jgi:type 1 fimbriae regulatory protein FimB/type 1 fimbriae regulatory protein FimE